LLSVLTTIFHTSFWSHNENIWILQTYTIFLFYRPLLLIVMAPHDVICLSYHIVLQEKSAYLFEIETYHHLYLSEFYYFILLKYHLTSLYVFSFVFCPKFAFVSLLLEITYIVEIMTRSVPISINSIYEKWL
jgi:hypothetical protein